MSVREIEGLTYEPKANYAKGMCVLCGYYGCRCEARPTKKPREKKKPGATLCGRCWEDGDVAAIREAVSKAGRV